MLNRNIFTVQKKTIFYLSPQQEKTHLYIICVSFLRRGDAYSSTKDLYDKKMHMLMLGAGYVA
jgi:hypothetical protein